MLLPWRKRHGSLRAVVLLAGWESFSVGAHYSTGWRVSGEAGSYVSQWARQLAAIAELAEREGRYGERAYVFVLKALDRAVRRLPERRHLSGRELLEAIRELATDLYGPTAPLVLEHWGIRTTLDFGHIVFSLVEAGVLTKTEEDSLEDFKDVFDFKEEFVRKYPWGSGAAGP